jgi:hypothetical protein
MLMPVTVAPSGPLRRFDAVAGGVHTYRLPIVRELPRPPAAAGATDLNW